MEEENRNIKSELRLNYSLKEALLHQKEEVSFNLACMFVCIFTHMTFACIPKAAVGELGN